VLEQPRTLHLVTPIGDVVATTVGRMRHQAQLRSDLPAVGDWVAFTPPSGTRTHATVQLILPRRTKLSRKVPGTKTDEQVVAANVDRVFLLMGLDGDFSPRRVERYVLMFREAGVDGVVLLNKLDLAANAAEQIAAVRALAGTLPVVAISCKHSIGLEALEPWLEPASTVALVGSSGVGKSTLINRLAGEERQATGGVRDRDDRGQHTTRHRELVRLSTGAILVDNPGIRELQPWVREQSLEATFPDVIELTAHCRFSDCRHESEPGCAIRAAIARGELGAERLDSFRALQAQVAQLSARQRENETKQAQRRLAARQRPAPYRRTRS
jgi:ribosome biogenesis GTPase